MPWAECGILFPWVGIEPIAPVVEAWSLTTGHRGRPMQYSISKTSAEEMLFVAAAHLLACLHRVSAPNSAGNR